MRTRELLKYGSVASATIIKGEIKSAGKGQSITLTYQFVDSEGNVVESISKSLPAGDYPLAVARRLAVTSNPTVLFDPRNSSHSLLYPPSGPRCVPRNVNF